MNRVRPTTRQRSSAKQNQDTRIGPQRNRYAGGRSSSSGPDGCTPLQPILLYDGDCAFCQSCVDLLDTRLLGGGSADRVQPSDRQSAESNSLVTVTPWQTADLDSLGVSEEQVRTAVIWIDTDGFQREGAGAIAALLRTRTTAFARVTGATLQLPVIRLVARLVYGIIARNRHRIPGGTQACRTSAEPDHD